MREDLMAMHHIERSPLKGQTSRLSTSFFFSFFFLLLRPRQPFLSLQSTKQLTQLPHPSPFPLLLLNLLLSTITITIPIPIIIIIITILRPRTKHIRPQKPDIPQPFSLRPDPRADEDRRGDIDARDVCVGMMQCQMCGEGSCQHAGPTTYIEEVEGWDGIAVVWDANVDGGWRRIVVLIWRGREES
jgi:hypothetical protein